MTSPSAAAAAFLIVDDETLARIRLRALLAEIAPQANLVEAAHAAQALEILGRGGIELAFLDIQMPGLDGVALAQRVRRLDPAPALVFVTAHAEHAVTAFELEALDYLTKPVRRERLSQALQKWERTRSASRLPQHPGEKNTEETLLIHDRGQSLRLPVDDILYCKAEQKYVLVRTAARTYLTEDSLADLEQRFPARFLRVHRSAIVARRALHALERADDPADGEAWQVRLRGLDETVAVSRRQLGAVRDELARN